MLEKKEKRIRRHKRVRAKIKGTTKIPRLCVFRSSKHIYVQLINDEKNEVLASVSDQQIKKTKKVSGDKKDKKSGKINSAYEVGRLIAEEAKKLKIEKAVFDRAGFLFHGRVKSLADGARENGLKF